MSSDSMNILAVNTRSMVRDELKRFCRETPSKRKLSSPVIKNESGEANDNVKTKISKATKTIRVEYEESGESSCNVKEEKINVSKIEGPPNWQEILENIKKMRDKKDAPVDTMGCDKCMDNDAQPQTYRWQILVSLMLSSQTKDNVTFEAMNKLKTFGLTIENILKVDEKRLENLIYPVGFYKKKVHYLKRTAQILKDDYQGDIPSSVKDLCKLPGVGPKMAHLCMKTAWGEITGIGVDTHVHRISNRLKWVNSKTPERTRTQLEKWLPKDLWNSVNTLLVGFGQQICVPLNPKCEICLNRNICPSSKCKTKSEF